MHHESYEPIHGMSVVGHMWTLETSKFARYREGNFASLATPGLMTVFHLRDRNRQEISLVFLDQELKLDGSVDDASFVGLFGDWPRQLIGNL